MQTKMPPGGEAVAEEKATAMITMTPAAVRKARSFLERPGDDAQYYLRLGVRGGGCSGYSYVLELDQDVDPEYDRILEFEGVKIVVDRKSLLLLAGTELDYAGDLHVVGDGGFVFNNPNARRGCGCGTSFQL